MEQMQAFYNRDSTHRKRAEALTTPQQPILTPSPLCYLSHHCFLDNPNRPSLHLSSLSSTIYQNLPPPSPQIPLSQSQFEPHQFYNFMHETINFLSIIDSKIKRSRASTPKNTQSLKQKLHSRRSSKYPYAKAIDFHETQYGDFPKWLTQKQGFVDFMYNNYENKLMSIPKICEKKDRASDEKYFVSLFMEQIPIFSGLPPVVNDIILSELKTRYYKAGDVIHYEEDVPAFMGVVYIGAVQYRSEKKMVTKEKNEVFMAQAFYGRRHETVTCKEEAIVLVLERQVYDLIVTKLREDIEMKQRDEINDLLKSTFFTQLHIKDKRARHFYSDCQLQFYFKQQTIAAAGGEVSCFTLLFKGDVVEQNHIYIRQHNKWPLPNRKWEVRAVYNSYHKNNRLKQFDFFGDEEIITNSKFKSKYVSASWVVLFTMPTDLFLNSLTSEDIKRLKKYRSEHVDINYGDFEKNIREKVRALSEKRKIVHKAINTSLASRSHFSPKRMSLINNFEHAMLSKTFFSEAGQLLS